MNTSVERLVRPNRYEGLNLISLPVWVFDLDHKRVLWANEAAVALWNSPSLHELCWRDMGADMSASVRRRLAQYQSDFVAHDATFNEQWTLYPAGQPLPMNVSLRGHLLEDGRMAMLCEARPSAVAEPESLRSVEALLHTAVMISLYDPHGCTLYRNPAARSSVHRLDERLDERFVDPAAYPQLMRLLADSGMATQTLAVRTAQGERWHEISVRRCKDAVTGGDAMLVSEADVSILKRTEARAQFLALHDALTGLPNRSQVMQRFDEAVGRIGDLGEQAALLFIDLDHFKNVNDTLGHAAGDALLVEVARRLRTAVRNSDLVARLGGDEFLLLLVGPDILHEVERVRARLMNALAEPMSLLGQSVHITPSVGVALYPQDGQNVDTLLRNADLAMYSAKERGRNDLAFYDAGMSEALNNRTSLEADLRLAFEREEFEVHYQSIVDVASGRTVGAEALVRWRHPERGMIPPDVFIPVCEGNGSIRNLGRIVFNAAARQQVAWAAAGHVLKVAVNLSPRQLRDPELLADLKAALQSSGADPRWLQLELTESMFLGRDPAVLALLNDIQTLGLGLSLDDFGTGYSNLAYLQQFPIQTLKIDRSFVQCLDVNRPVAELIVAMCRLMKLGVVAEGVETTEQLAWVRAQGIAQSQGFLHSRPLPAAAFTALVVVDCVAR